MSGHSAKRQRLTGSFSPASPPYHLAAKPSETKTPIIHPNTPTSPPYSSMNSQSNGGPAMTATAAPLEMTPPSSVNMSQQQFSPSGPSATNPPPFPTPASTAGPSHSMNLDSNGDAMMEDRQDDDAVRLGERRRSNHNRQNRAIFSEDGIAAAKGVCGSQLFKLCQSTVEESRPHASQNLFELYNLNGLARSVARTDPITGEKINKLRKSYEGHIKALQIAGKPKAVKMDGKLTGLLDIKNEDDWKSLNVTGKEIHMALTPDGTNLTSDLDRLLDGAFAGLAPGALAPKDTAMYRAYLGTDDAVKSKSGPEAAPHRVLPSAGATPNPHTPSAAPIKSRPERLGSKRHYTDASFHGYGEGYGDDYADSTGGEDNAQGAAKRRKLGFERTSHQVEVGGVRR